MVWKKVRIFLHFPSYAGGGGLFFQQKKGTLFSCIGRFGYTEDLGIHKRDKVSLLDSCGGEKNEACMCFFYPSVVAYTEFVC